jgi:predicted negative regulator of RcsB-dependent stress response
MSEKNIANPISGTPLAELTQAQPATESFLDKHQIKLIALALLLIAVAVVVVVNREIRQGKEAAAGALLVSKGAAPDLEEIIKNFEGTAAAGSSKILLAEKQWEDGQQDSAITTLRAITDSKVAHPARPTAIASLAAKLISQGKITDAEELYTELTESADSQYLAAYAWISLGDIALVKGDQEAAEKAYTTVERDFSGTSLSQDAINRRLLMNAESPAELAAPIELPDAKITDGEGAPGKNVEINDMLDALKAAGLEANFPQPPPEENKTNK